MSTKILFVGDTHFDSIFLKSVYKHAKKLKADIIFQVGDFGYFPADPKGMKYLDLVSSLYDEYSIPLYFLGGNHDDWNFLDLKLEEYNITYDNLSFCPILDGLIYVPNGMIWNWNDFTFGVMGGAFSIDRKEGVLNYDWFYQEIGNDNQFNQFLGKKLDIFLCHDAPTSINKLKSMFNLPSYIEQQSEHFRRKLESEIVFETAPNYVIHGHWHQFIVSKYITNTRLGAHYYKGISLAANYQALNRSTYLFEF